MRETCAQIRSIAGDAIESGEYVSADNVDTGCYEQNESEASISEYPTLIYDGPFSESAENRAPQADPGERITAEQATQKAQALFVGGKVLSTAYVAGALPVYELTMDTADRGQVSLSLTEQGGQLLSFMGEPTGTKNDPPSDQESRRLKEAALSFLQEMGVEDPAVAYAQYYQGVAVLNFAPRQAGVILYSDLIKVYLDRENGQVMGIDARNYRLNHRQRALDKPRITREQAAEYVSDGLAIEHVDLALIPLTQCTEVLCYEFKATRGETFYIVYINALTGQEEQIFQVINSGEGDLVV